ncbi:sensor histidine kinase [Kitasatospora sp. NPDC096147]|uniref:sensor histidine kinase n=1 Tax=Kitasatospora sp. NPDC096147 TaxID=3364093 RepID=UPI0038210178
MRIPLLGRFSPATWTVLAWCAGTVLTGLFRMRLPGEYYAAVLPGVVYLRWDGLVMLALAGLCTLWGARRLMVRPASGLAWVLAGAVLGTLPLSVGEIPLQQYLAVDVAVYLLAVTLPRRRSLRMLGAALGLLAGYLAFRMLQGWPAGVSVELTVALLAVISWLLGSSTRQAREHHEETRARATEQAVTDERLRIARELHDMVAHSMGVIALQAGAAKRVIDRQPEAAREALASIETTGRETLAGLRRMLVALRTDDPLTPDLGVADLPALAESTTAAGLRVELRHTGGSGPLPPEVDVSAYRIVQESLTNVLKHARTDHCLVTVGQLPDALVLEVTDHGTGPGRGSGPPGFGLAGMRERVALLHGELHAGPLPGGGWRVTARLPLSASPLDPAPPAGTTPTGARAR